MSIIKLNNQAVKNATEFGSISSLGSMVFIKKLTASSSATLSFVDGSDGVVLDNTYKEYLFTFKNIHPATNNAHFGFQVNASGGSGYDETITSSVFRAIHNEADNDQYLHYENNSADKAQGTDLQYLQDYVGADNDQSCSGILHLFNPSSTTFVKHFICRTANYNGNDYAVDQFTAGYINTTSAVDEVQFKFHSGNLDAGDICLYGIA
jgi:hypothetical protein